MAHNARIRPTALDWDVDVVLPAEFEKFDQGQFVGINGDDGGAYAPSAAVVVGGLGFQFTTVVSFGASSVTTWSNGAVVNVGSGAWNFASGAVIDLLVGGIHEIHGRLRVQSGGHIDVKSGGVANVESGGTLSMAAGSGLSLATPIIGSVTPTTRTLIMEHPVNSGWKLRWYIRHNTIPYSAGWEVTQNAQWTGTQWTPDDTGVPAYIEEHFSGPYPSVNPGDNSALMLREKLATGLGNWSETGWDVLTCGIAIGQPAATAVITENVMYGNTVPKARGQLSTDGAGGCSILGGFGLTSAVISGSEILVTMQTSMTTSAYCPMVGMVGINAIPNIQSIVSVNSFRIGFRDFVGNSIDPGAIAVKVNFTVDGNAA